ncbi:hypothetical protein A1OO_13660 [Enterovibrio norvegicus FF-33]|uniref:hypothetical protein n=1 Tax=Enterovibrio TaxID=188143 RepID=UPI0002EFDE3F|nr:hypothetical protein [Enterovibrio norvegicus]OEE66808.1 hypothetical protein A1OO_13660 [Enterovibrio norvegicus FF-33]
MTSANKKGALLFAGGLVLGGLVAGNHWSSISNVAQELLEGVNTQLTQSQSELIQAQQTIVQLEEAMVARTSDAATTEGLIEQKDVEIDQLKAQLVQLTHQAKQMDEMKATLDIKVADQVDSISKLRARLQNTDVLYAERYRLAQAVSDLNERIFKASHKAESSQQACEEFKKGNSWNWVSEKDCDNFNTYNQKAEELMAEFEDQSASLDKVNRELSAFGNLPVPQDQLAIPQEPKTTPKENITQEQSQQ